MKPEKRIPRTTVVEAGLDVRDLATITKAIETWTGEIMESKAGTVRIAIRLLADIAQKKGLPRFENTEEAIRFLKLKGLHQKSREHRISSKDLLEQASLDGDINFIDDGLVDDEAREEFKRLRKKLEG